MAYFKCAFSNSGATLTVECDSFMAGAIVTCSNGAKTLQGLCPSTSPYEVTFKIPEEGTWVVSTIISGATYSTSVDIDFSFEASLSGFNWMLWLTEGGLDPSDYNDLSEVLADEKALRQLNLVHASVDYMASILATHPDVETIIAEGLFAKWANLSDYALDHMEANEILSDLMDEADLYGYGELIEDNGSYVPKGNVPVMTSNTAPYGEAFSTGAHPSHPAWQGFDKNASTSGTFTNAVNNVIGYRFTNPIMPKKLIYSMTDENKYVVKASNDGSTWDTISEEFTGQATTDVEIPLTATKYYLYCEICETVNVTLGSYITFKEVQFYGRELKVSVPTMTSRTAPYGNILAPADLASNTAAWRAFDGTSYCWNYNALHTIGYEFVKPAVVNILGIKNRQDTLAAPPKKFNLVGSNDGGTTWETVLANLECNNTTFGAWMFFDISNTTPYKAYGIEVTEMQSNTVWINEITFYGKDYTEKEFANDGSKWLYDHGVYPTNNELEEISDYEGSPYVNRGVITDIGGTGFDIDTSVTSASFKTLGFKNSEDLTANNLLRMRNNIYNLYGADACLDISSMSGLNYIAFESFTSQGGAAGSAMLVTSAKHSTPELARRSANGHIITVHEVWLE